MHYHLQPTGSIEVAVPVPLRKITVILPGWNGVEVVVTTKDNAQRSDFIKSFAGLTRTPVAALRLLHDSQMVYPPDTVKEVRKVLV